MRLSVTSSERRAESSKKNMARDAKVFEKTIRLIKEGHGCSYVIPGLAPCRISIAARSRKKDIYNVKLNGKNLCTESTERW